MRHTTSPSLFRLQRFIALVLVVGCTPPPALRPTPPAQPVIDQVAALVAAGREEQQVPGASVVVLSGDDVVLARGYGVESIERADSVTPATVFELGSISKQLTAALILRLAEEGRLSLDEPVSRRLPDFAHVPASLTIRHLLTHTSGMRELAVHPELAAALAKPGTTAAEFETIARRTPSDILPGTRWAYGSINYLMLTWIAERVTGERLEDALRARFFRPLGLTTMRQCPSHPGAVRGEARGHVRSAQGLAPNPPESFHLFAGAGGMCASALDAARWTRALATGRVVSAASYAQMLAPARLNDGRTADYGMGMVLVSPDSARRLGHGGYGGGFSGQLAYYPDAELTVVVLLNRFVFAEQVERRIARRLLGVPEATVRAVALTPEERQRFVGTFDMGIPGWAPAVVERDGKLWFEPRVLPPLPLTYVGDGEFVREGQPYGYRLYFDPDAREMRVLGMGMMSWYGRRRS